MHHQQESYFPLKALPGLCLKRNTLKALPLAGFLNHVLSRAARRVRKITGKPLPDAGFRGWLNFIKGLKIFCCQ